MHVQQPLTEAELLSLLKKTSLQGVSLYDETDSTNTQSLSLLASEEIAQTPHLVYAESQTSGRGRGAKRWWSSAGSLTFSLIVDWAQLGILAEQQMQLPLLTGMALLQTGQAVIPQAEFALKWPNDVYLAGRKLAGILIEVPSRLPPATPGAASSFPRHAVIGVGLNVNNQFAEAPPDLRATAISLSDISGHSHDRIEILTSFLRHLETLIQALALGRPVLDQWPAFCLLRGKSVTLEVGGTDVSGFCRGIDTTGALLLETNTGQKRFVGGVVKSWS